MIQRALAFLVRQGPVSEQDRWEEDAGLNTFTLAVCIAALVAGARYLPADGRDLALAFADYWNARLEDWTAVRRHPAGAGRRCRATTCAWRPRRRSRRRAASPTWSCRFATSSEDPRLPASAQVGMDFLQLVRFGLRSAQMIRSSSRASRWPMRC